MTSTDFNVKFTVRPLGRYSSFAVTTVSSFPVGLRIVNCG